VAVLVLVARVEQVVVETVEIAVLQHNLELQTSAAAAAEAGIQTRLQEVVVAGL
jgi:hypothetical protein